jgi:hypothetical protein
MLRRLCRAALAAMPKFYTQVLHLMNKMNLPPPFEGDFPEVSIANSDGESELDSSDTETEATAQPMLTEAGVAHTVPSPAAPASTGHTVLQRTSKTMTVLVPVPRVPAPPVPRSRKRKGRKS